MLGRVAIAPVDVILDRERALVLQPDVLFVATERLGIIRDQVWGAPDLVVEVMSPGTEQRDRTREARVVPAVRCARMLARGPAPGARHCGRFDRRASGPTHGQGRRRDSIVGPAGARDNRGRRFSLGHRGRTWTSGSPGSDLDFRSDPGMTTSHARFPSKDRPGNRYATPVTRPSLRLPRTRPLPALHRRRAPVDRARHRRQYRDLHAGRRGPAEAPAGQGARPARPVQRRPQPLRQQLGRQHAVVPDVRGLPRQLRRSRRRRKAAARHAGDRRQHAPRRRYSPACSHGGRWR